MALKGARPKREKEKVIDLFVRAQADRNKAAQAKREELVVQFRLKARKLARSILRKWHARLDIQEVDSLVDLSLCEAVRRYNPRKGASFMTFLYYHLRGNLIRAVTYAATLNTVPIREEHNEPLEEEGERSRRGYRAANAIEAAEALCGSDHAMPDDALIKKELVGLSLKACARLDALEREVIERLYLEGRQLMDIARSLGYSRCHISRVKKRAAQRLKRNIGALAA